MKLFAVYLGGYVDRCNIELHDVVFVAGPTLEATYPQLRKKWFGNSNRFHIDAFIDLQHVDGHEVFLATKPTASAKLYFINMGAYDPVVFSEIHQSAFYVAASPAESIARAKAELCQGLQQIHKDDVVTVDTLQFDTDDVIEVNVEGYFISLKPAPGVAPSQPVPAYIKLPVF